MKSGKQEAKGLRRQIRYVLKTSGGRLELGGVRTELLRSIGSYLDRMKFGSREEGAKALGISPSRLDYVLERYRKLPRPQKKIASGSGKKIRLAPVKIIDAEAASPRTQPRRVELVLESGVRVSVESADAAIELLHLLEQRSRLKAAS